MKISTAFLVCIFYFVPLSTRGDITGVGVARNTGTASAASGGDNLKIYFTTPVAGNGFNSIHLTKLTLFTFTTGNYLNSINAELYDSDGTTLLGHRATLEYDFKNTSNSFNLNSENFGIELELNKRYNLFFYGLDPSLPAKYAAYDGPLTTPTLYGSPGASFWDTGTVNTDLAIPNLAFTIEASTAIPEPTTILLFTLALLVFASFVLLTKQKERAPASI